MTRVQPRRPVWTWQCDGCGHREHLAWEASGTNGLPSADDMRAQGWTITAGVPIRDLCPTCTADAR